MFKKVGPNLLAILDAAHKIQQYTRHLQHADEFFADEKTFDAVLMNFVVIGESANRIPASFQALHSHIFWRAIADFRNIIAHNYFGVDAAEVWQIIQQHLPQLVHQVAALVADQQQP